MNVDHYKIKKLSKCFAVMYSKSSFEVRYLCYLLKCCHYQLMSRSTCPCSPIRVWHIALEPRTISQVIFKTCCSIQSAQVPNIEGLIRI